MKLTKRSILLILAAVALNIAIPVYGYCLLNDVHGWTTYPPLSALGEHGQVNYGLGSATLEMAAAQRSFMHSVVVMAIGNIALVTIASLRRKPREGFDSI